MADISLVVEVKQKGVVNAVKGTKALEGNVKLLSDSFKKGDLSQRQYYKGISQLAQAANKSESELRKYASELRKVQKASNVAKASAKAEATAVKAYAQARKEATEANARFNAKAKEAAAVAKANALEEERLKNKFVEGYTAMNIYTKELNDLAVARKRGIISAKEQAAAVASLNAQMKAGTGVFANAASGMQVIGKRANRAGVLAQQAGYQFGDFAVQVQSGTNIMVAAGQQATQLVGTLSMLAKSTKMIGIFAGLGVIIPVLTGIGAYLMRTAEAADTASDKADDFKGALNSARSEVQGMEDDLRLLASGLENVFELTLSDAVKEAEESLKTAVAELDFQTALIALDPKGVEEGIYDDLLKDQGEVIAGTEEAVRLAELELHFAQELARQEEQRARDASVVNQLHQVRQQRQNDEKEAAEAYLQLSQEAYESQIQQLEVAREIVKHGEGSVEVARLRAYYEAKNMGLVDSQLASYVQLATEIYEIARDTEAAARGAAEFAKVDISAGVRAAAQAAQDLATHLGVSLRAAMAMQGMISTRMTGDVFDPRDPSNQGSDAALERTRRIMEDGTLTSSLTPPRTRSGRGGGGGGTPFDQDAYLESLQKEAEFKQTLVNMTEEQATEEERRREIINKIQSEGKVADEARIQTLLDTEAATRRLIEAEEQRQATFDMVSGHIESAFMSMVDGSKSVEDAFKGMIRAILLEVYQQAIAKPMANAITSFLGFKDGGAFSGGRVIPFANGGVVSSATMFPMAGNQTGVMGEAGPEAIMPLKRGNDGKLGIQVNGGGENVVIHQNFNFSANGDDSVKKIIAQAAPQIANMTQKQIMDSRRRGGAMKSTFG